MTDSRMKSQQPKVSTIATFPPGYFLENIVALCDDTLIVTVANRKCIYALPPPTASGQARQPYLLHQFENDAWAFGIATAPNDPRFVYIITTDFLFQGSCTHHLHVLDVSNVGAACHPRMLVQFPLTAKGLNGLTAIADNVFVAADSFGGCIWRIDIVFDATGSPTTARVSEWMRDPAFDGQLVLPDFQPGVNGLKYSHALQALCFSNTQQRLFGTIPVNPETSSRAGPVKILIYGPQGDDLIVDDLFEDGPVAYLTTHRDNSILRISLQTSFEVGTCEIVAGVTALDTQVLGPTSGAWKWGGEGKTAYFNCDGGLKNPLPGEPPRFARILQMDL